MCFEQYNFILEQVLLSAEPLKFDVSKKKVIILEDFPRGKQRIQNTTLPTNAYRFFFFSFCRLSKLLTLRTGRKTSLKMELIIKESAIMPLKVSQP